MKEENRFFRSWASAETVVDFPQHNCVVCKEGIDLMHENQLHQDKSVIVDKSSTLLVCKNCTKVSHVHCFLNIDIITPDILVDTISKFLVEEYHCPECVQ